jgi:hypothetical protein
MYRENNEEDVSFETHLLLKIVQALLRARRFHVKGVEIISDEYDLQLPLIKIMH